ncbi:unnamed protein product [Cyclocybe aegerita]|uniref:Uncharacterized protein n=1 Tax=Cyclocybe aegerita TaxID=1973307 RepID=A0A8S0WV25_CYCAE|nr:unnamed protein product [Cyclocybe aegerita]
MRFSQVQVALLATALVGAPAVLANEADEVTSVNAREATVEVEARQEAPVAEFEARDEAIELEARHGRGARFGHALGRIVGTYASHRMQQGRRDLDDVIDLEARHGSGRGIGRAIGHGLRHVAKGFAHSFSQQRRDLTDVEDLEARRGGGGGGGGGHWHHRRDLTNMEDRRELTEEPEVLQRRIDDFEALLARYAESEAAQLD